MGYTKGLHEIADGVWAYLQPDGGWGWSNAGLITGGDSSLLVDTLFDLLPEACRRHGYALHYVSTWEMRQAVDAAAQSEPRP